MAELRRPAEAHRLDGGEQNRLYYEEWVEREGLDLIRGYSVDNVYQMPLKPWARTGGNAVRIQLDGTGDHNDALVCEIPPGKQLEPQKHLFEEQTFILSGRGSTVVWYEGQRKNSFEWQAGSLFCIPLNACFQHFNLSGEEPVRYLSTTTVPLMLNLMQNEDFIFNNPATFPERYDSGERFFSGEMTMREVMRETGIDRFETAFTNFVADINAIPSNQSARAKGARGRVVQFGPGQFLLGSHSTFIPGRTFSTIHRHGPGTHVLWLRGEGYALMWPDGGEKLKIYWGPGSIVVPPEQWWHHWVVVSEEPAQNLAQHHPRIDRSHDGSMISTQEGGRMVLVDDFSPELRAEIQSLFDEECRKYDERKRAEMASSKSTGA